MIAFYTSAQNKHNLFQQNTYGQLVSFPNLFAKSSKKDKLATSI
jgi:hypothetical protein